MTATGFIHLKPWNQTFTDPVCACMLTRLQDGGVSFIPCADCREALMRVRARKRFGRARADIPEKEDRR